MNGGYYYTPHENYQAFTAERIARVIVAYGCRSLFDIEKNMCKDPKLRKMVIAFIYIIKRDNFLTKESEENSNTLSLQITSKISHFFVHLER